MCLWGHIAHCSGSCRCADGVCMRLRLSVNLHAWVHVIDPLAGLPVVLVVSTEGIRTIDNISREETHKVFLQDLVYFAPVTLKRSGTIVPWMMRVPWC